MGTITPMLDTLLPQVFGRRGDVERIAAAAYQQPLAAVRGLTPPRPRNARPEPEVGQLRGGVSSSIARAPIAGDPKAAITPATSGPDAGDEDPAVSAQLYFSKAAHSIARLLRQMADAPAAPVAARAPLLAAGQAPIASVLVAMLDRQVGYSGLFYEAHLGQWLQGKRPQRKLYEEPQMRWLMPAGADRGKLGTMPARSARGAPGLASVVDSSSALAAHQQANAGYGDQPILDERLLPLLSQQLAIANNGIFRWQGQVWPGATMHWEIREDDEAAQRRTAAPAVRCYTTSLRLDLPALGVLEIRLALTGHEIQVQAWAEQSAGAAMLHADRRSLQQRLYTTGFNRATVELVAKKAT